MIILDPKTTEEPLLKLDADRELKVAQNNAGVQNPVSYTPEPAALAELVAAKARMDEKEKSLAASPMTQSRADLAPELTSPTPPELMPVVGGKPGQTQGDMDREHFEMFQQAQDALAGGGAPGLAGEWARAYNVDGAKKTLRAYKEYRTKRGERPFQYLGKADERARRKDWQEKLPVMVKLFAGADKMAEALPVAERAAWEENFAHSMNPARDKMQAVNMRLVAEMEGKSLDEIAPAWGAIRSQFAQKHFGQTGYLDDATFYQVAGKALAGEQADGQLMERVANRARVLAMQGKPLAESLAETRKLAGERWKEFEPAARQGHAAMLAAFSDEDLKVADVLWNEFQAKRNEKGASQSAEAPPIDDAMLAYGQADQAGREKIANLIALRAQEEGEDVTNYFARVGQAFKSGAYGQASGLAAALAGLDSGAVDNILKFGKVPSDMPEGDATQAGADMVSRRILYASEEEKKAMRPLTPEERAFFKNEKSRSDGQRAFLTDLPMMGVKSKRYLDAERNGFWDTLSDTVVQGVESVPAMAMAALPYGGGLVLGASAYAEQDMAELRKANPNVSSGALERVAYTSGLLKFGVDRLQIGIMGARMPKVTAWAYRQHKLLRYPAAFAIKAGVSGAAETFQEVGQDLTLPVVNDLADALGQDLKGTDWKAVMKKEYDALGDIARVALLFGVIGGAGHTIADVMDMPKIKETLMDRQGLAVAGYDEATITKVVTEAETNPLAAAETLKAAAIETPAEVRRANSEAAVKAQKANPPPTATEAGIPEIIMADDGSGIIRYPDGTEDAVDSMEEAMGAMRVWEQDESNLQEQGIKGLLKHFEGYHEGSDELAAKGKYTGKEVSYEKWAGSAKERSDQAHARVSIALRGQGLEPTAENTDLSKYLILGSSRNSYGRGVTRIAMEINKAQEGTGRAGATVLTPIEEHAEGVAKHLMDTGKKSESWFIQNLRELEAATLQGNTMADNLMDMAPELRRQEVVEAFSRLAVANATGKIQDSAVPAALKAIFRAIKETISAILSLAADIKTFRDAGKLDSEFGYWLDVAGGVQDDYRGENMVRALEAEMLAEAMDGMPEIQSAIKGRLPRPETLKERSHPLVGEVQALYDAIKQSEEAGANQAARTRKANEFFLPVGEMEDLDNVRESLNQQGFDFETPADMLDAAMLSLGYGKPQYGTSNMGDSFSVGRATVTPTEETQVFQGAEGSPSVIGPASFSIAAYHGTPHKVDKFSTDKIGTGGGRQIYGFGLYFTDEKEYAEKFIKNVSAPADAGNLYTVRLDVNDEDLLSWDTPISEQGENVISAFQRAMEKFPDKSIYLPATYSGGMAFKEIRKAFGEGDGFPEAHKAASLLLKELGIPGVKVQGSGNIYVIFDESLIKIEEENGTPVQMGGASFSIGRADVNILIGMSQGQPPPSVRPPAAEDSVITETEETDLIEVRRALLGSGDLWRDVAGDYYDAWDDEKEMSEGWIYRGELYDGATADEAAKSAEDLDIDPDDMRFVYVVRDHHGFIEETFESEAERDDWREEDIKRSFEADVGGGGFPEWEESHIEENRILPDSDLAAVLKSIPGVEAEIFGSSVKGTISRAGGEYRFDMSVDGSTLSVVSLLPVGKWKGSGDSVGIELIAAIAVHSKLLGLSSIKTTGGKSDGMTGYRTWPALGFEAKVSSSNFPDLLPNCPPTQLARMSELGKDGSGGLSLLKLTSTKEGAFLWRNHGSSISLALDLSPASPGIQRLVHQIGKIEKRIVRNGGPGGIGPDGRSDGGDGRRAASLESTSQVSYSVAHVDSPVLKAIDALQVAPEKKAEIYQKMATRVREIRGRYDKRKAGSDEQKARHEMLRDLATLEAVAKSLPPAIRGKIIQSFRKMEGLRSVEGREAYMIRLLPKIEQSLENHLQNQYRMAIRREFDRGAMKVSESKTRGGKIGGVAHAIYEQAKAAMKLEPEQADATAEKLTATLENAQSLTEEELEELDGKIAALTLFQDFDNATSARLEEALTLLKDVYRDGRREWLKVLGARRELKLGRVAVLLEGMNMERRIEHADRSRAKRVAEKVTAGLSEGFMAAMLSNSQKIRRLGELTNDPNVRDVVDSFEGAMLDAELAENDANSRDQKAFAAAMRQIFKVNTEYGTAKKLKELATIGEIEQIPVTKIEGFSEKKIKVPKKLVESILRGETSGFQKTNGEMVELDAYDVAALEKAMDAFEGMEEADQNRGQVVVFIRRRPKGERKSLGPLNQLEALQLWLTMRQPDQSTKMTAMGYDEVTMEEIENHLKPEVKELGLWMVEYLEKEKGTLDAIHRAEKGVGLGLVENYFPIRNDVAGADNSGLALDGAGQMQGGRSVSSLKERVANYAPPANVNALAVFLQTRGQVNFWKAHVGVMREWGGVVRDERFALAVQTRMGNTYYQSLKKTMERIEGGGSLKKGNLGIERLMKGVMRTNAMGILGMRASTIWINATAALNVLWEVPAPKLISGMLKVLKRPEAFADAWNSPSIRRRLEEGTSPEAKAAQASGPTTHPVLAVLQTAAEKGMYPINFVDTSANMLGAVVVWETTRKEAIGAGLDSETAKSMADAKVERVLLRTAQPTTRLGKSEFEQSFLDFPLAAPLAMFISEPRKNMAITYMAIRELTTGKGNYGKAQAAQQAALGLVGIVAAEYLFKAAFAAFAKAKDDEEDDVFERFWKSLSNAKAWGYAFTGSQFKAVPIAGEMWNALMADSFGQPVFDKSPNPMMELAELPRYVGDVFDGTTEKQSKAAMKVVQAVGRNVPGGPVFAQAANVTEFFQGVLTSNGMAFSDEDRIRRISARYQAAEKQLEKQLGKTTGADGKINKEIQAKKHAALADKLRAEVAGMNGTLKKATIEKIKPPEAVKSRLN